MIYPADSRYQGDDDDDEDDGDDGDSSLDENDHDASSLMCYPKSSAEKSRSPSKMSSPVTRKPLPLSLSVAAVPSSQPTTSFDTQELQSSILTEISVASIASSESGNEGSQKSFSQHNDNNDEIEPQENCIGNKSTAAEKKSSLPLLHNESLPTQVICTYTSLTQDDTTNAISFASPPSIDTEQQLSCPPTQVLAPDEIHEDVENDKIEPHNALMSLSFPVGDDAFGNKSTLPIPVDQSNEIPKKDNASIIEKPFSNNDIATIGNSSIDNNDDMNENLHDRVNEVCK